MKKTPNGAVLWGGLLCAFGLLAFCVRGETVTAEPDAFLDYIEANGSQYINTGVNAETGLKARIDLEIGSYSGNADWGFLDAATVASASDNRKRIFLCHLYNYKPFFGYGLKQRGNPSGTFRLDGGNRYEIVSDMTDTNSLELVQNGKKTFSADDRTKYSTNGVVNLNLPLFIFATNYGGKPDWYGQGKLYELKIWKKNATTGELDLIRHYLPCIKDGRAGLYDKVNGTISFSYGNKQSPFVAGPVLDKPLDFVKWIWGNNKQWFDTRVWGKSGLKSEVDVGVREYDGDRCILGCRGTDGDTRVYMAYNFNSHFVYGYGKLKNVPDIAAVTPTNDVSYKLDTRYLIKADLRNGYQSVTVSKNGGAPTELVTNAQTYVESDMATTNTLYLLAINKHGTATCSSKCVVYRTKIWDGDELLRDFVPVVATNSAGVAYAGLYDTVSERIFRQIGTAEFNLTNQVGGVTNTLRVVSRPKTRVEYVDSDASLDYVNLGLIAKDGVEMEAVMEWLSVPSDGAFVGARHNDASGAHRFFLYHYWHDSSAGSRHRLCYDNDLFAVGSSPATANVKYRIASKLDVGRGDMSISAFTDGAWSEVASRTVLPENGYDGPVDTGLPLYLFQINLDGTPRFPGKVRLYSLKLRVKQQDGTYALARDLVPVKDPATGAPVLWDRVGETYFRNGGKYLLAGGGAERPFDGGVRIIVR